MDTNDSKPQQTGGLKLMTVFIAVLALHVLVIGGFTVYHLMGSGGGDADLTLDKPHKLKADLTATADANAQDAASPDKTADATTGTATSSDSASTSGTAASGPTSATDTATSTAEAAAETAAPAATPASTATQVAASTPATPAQAGNVPPAATPASSSSASPITISGEDMAQTSTIPAPLMPPPDVSPTPPAPTSTSASAAPASTAVTTAAASATAPATSVASAPEAKPALESAPAVTPASAPDAGFISAATPSGPVTPAGDLASGPVHMPLHPPQSPAGTFSSASEEHVPAMTHGSHALVSTREARHETYTVKITDSYAKIAHAHHISVAELKSVNHIRGNTLHAGQKLIIPLTKTELAKSDRLHESGTGITATTASLSAYPSSTALHHHHLYTVAKGDTLRKIARKFDVTASALEEANDLNGPKVSVGEKLRIPLHESHLAPSTATANAAPAPEPAPIQPRQVQTQPAPVEQPEPTPVAAPEPLSQPAPTPASNPELVNLTF